MSKQVKNSGVVGSGCVSQEQLKDLHDSRVRHPRNPHLDSNDKKISGPRFTKGKRPSTERGKRRHAARSADAQRHAESVWE